MKQQKKKEQEDRKLDLKKKMEENVRKIQADNLQKKSKMTQEDNIDIV